LEFWIWLQSFNQKIENKNICESETLVDRERHLTLEMSTSRMAHANRERENTPIKQQQGKAWATKAQQDLPVNVVINSRLLACKAKRDKLYNYAKPVLRVSLHFQVLALIKLLPLLASINQLYSNHYN
jgi:hypothetical protein